MSVCPVWTRPVRQPQQELTFRGSGNASEVDQLDALLTGGRLGAVTKAAVLDVYLASGGPVENVKVDQQAIVMTAPTSSPTEQPFLCPIRPHGPSPYLYSHTEINKVISKAMLSVISEGSRCDYGSDFPAACSKKDKKSRC